MPKVSIIIPTYNRVDLLARAMGSVKRQTHQDWEMIVVDDGSTDATAQMVQSWMLNDERIKYHKLPKNSGSPVFPRNFGVSKAQGNYITFLDADDKWFPNKLETQLWYMQHHNSDFSYHDLIVVVIDKLGREVRTEQWDRMSTCFSDMVFKFLLRKNFIPTSTVMMKKGLYERYGGMDAGLTISHDWDLWLRIAFEVPIHFVNEQLGLLQIHEGSVISETHRRRSESRQIIRKWFDCVDGMYYRKVMVYYYLMEVMDLLPGRVRKIIRSWWYSQDKYQKPKRD